MLDPASLQILISRLTGIAEEMGMVLRRSAFSPNIKERADCSAALFTAEGELLVQAEHIPVHLGSMPASVAAAIGLGRTDVPIVLNDPFAGGTHLNDITLVSPCVAGGRLAGWVANRAHHSDLGGMTPGSIPPDATEIQQEGLRIPPVALTDDVRSLIASASRTPAERLGDLDAQAGANALGVERFADFAGEPLSEITGYGERRMRTALSAIPDGDWEYEDVIDSVGPRDEQQTPSRICLKLSVRAENATFDFSGSSRQRPGNVNAVAAVTASAVAFALRTALDPTIPANGGAMRPIEIIAPAASIVAATPPVAVGAGNVEVSQRIADICLGALGLAAPGRACAAGQGTMNNVLIGGDGWVYYETIAGGQGAGSGFTGMSGVHTAMTNTRNTPVEALERHYPMRIHAYELRRGSGGAGASFGGDGIVREFEMLQPATVSLVTERRQSHPWGIRGGLPGARGENWLLPGGGEPVPLPDKVTLNLKTGDRLRIVTPGGGGFGAPSDS